MQRHPVSDDRNVARIPEFEQFVDPAGDDDIQIQEQTKPFDWEIVPKQAELAPPRMDLRFREIDRRDTVSLNARLQPLRVVREADESVTPSVKPSDYAMQSVDIPGPITVTPFQGDDIACCLGTFHTYLSLRRETISRQ